SVQYWPERARIFYHQVRDDGRNLDANLDLVKEDLREFVREHRLDTLFLSLGGGAKILGYELSRELGICCFDFGAMIRTFTYSGCDGNRVARSPHSPFFFRIPCQTHMDANLSLVKEDLREFVREYRIDTLFLSLGGGAKILGYELSRELRICSPGF